MTECKKELKELKDKQQQAVLEEDKMATSLIEVRTTLLTGMRRKLEGTDAATNIEDLILSLEVS